MSAFKTPILKKGISVDNDIDPKSTLKNIISGGPLPELAAGPEPSSLLQTISPIFIKLLESLVN